MTSAYMRMVFARLIRSSKMISHSLHMVSVSYTHLVDTSCIFLIEEVDNIQYVDILIIEKPGLFAQDFVYSLTDVNTSVL